MAEKDMLEKKLEAYNDVFADIVNVLLFDGEEIVKEDELEQITTHSTYKSDGKIREQDRDVLKGWNKVKNDDNEVKATVRIALLGAENQTVPEDDFPLRLMGYDGSEYRGQLYYVKNENGKRVMNKNPRYPVVTFVLYRDDVGFNRGQSL